jgi:hypothetical protein
LAFFTDNVTAVEHGGVPCLHGSVIVSPWTVRVLSVSVDRMDGMETVMYTVQVRHHTEGTVGCVVTDDEDPTMTVAIYPPIVDVEFVELVQGDASCMPGDTCHGASLSRGEGKDSGVRAASDSGRVRVQ